MNTINNQSRSVAKVIASIATHDGNGVPLRRLFPNQAIDNIDPFLLLDHLGPFDLPAGSSIGFPDHPHRGFETVTYMLQGRFQHKDSQGHQGILGPGDVQWMTAGSGVVHSEMPEREFAKAGGHLEGFQLWVNLPKRDKLTDPRYQEIPAKTIPLVKTDDGKVMIKVIAGEALGSRAVIETRTPITFLHLTLQPGAKLSQPVAQLYSCFAYAIDGLGLYGSKRQLVEARSGVIFNDDGDCVDIEAATESPVPLSVLLIAGLPLKEPISRAGPFVMNTKEELLQAYQDFQQGRMGQIVLK
jgi:redox-sensitive bicupin YhaK (pirin superfamily)